MSKRTKPIHRTKAIPNRVSVRRRMPGSAFAVPETKSYPIPDAYHAELALTALLRVVYRKEEDVVAEIHDAYDL